MHTFHIARLLSKYGSRCISAVRSAQLLKCSDRYCEESKTDETLNLYDV